ncbi:TPA: hypothetical protein JIR92_11725 [Acinetobacter baumannii]|nr:hypothetical protein [Acinetobacter baumannii]
MLNLFKKNRGEIVVVFLAVLAVYIISVKTDTPVKSIHFVIMSTFYSVLGIFSLKMAKRSIEKSKK